MITDQSPRSGCGDSGQDYEYLVPTLFALRLLTDDNVKDFAIASNVAGFGALDDLLVTTKSNDDVIERFAIQLKHKEKNLQPNALIADSGKFALTKYLEDFTRLSERNRNNYECILYTTAGFSDDNLRKVKQIKFEGKKINLRMIPESDCSGKKTFNTYNDKGKNRKNCTYKFHVDDTNEEKVVAFFEKFSLFVRQKNWKEVEDEIAEIFATKFGSTNWQDFTKLIRYWHRRLFVRIQLTREEIKFHLIESLLPQHLRLDPEENASFVKNFDVILVESGENFVKERIKSRRLVQNDETLLELGKNNMLVPKLDEELSPENRGKVARFFGNHPYVVHVTPQNRQQVLEVISLCKRDNQLKFVFLGRELTRENFPKNCFKILESFADVVETCDDFAQSFLDLPLIIQRRSVLVRELLEVSENFAQLLTTEKLLLLLDNNLVVGDREDDFFTLGPYMHRTLTVNTFSTASLSDVREGLLVISWDGNMDYVNATTKQIYHRRQVNDDNYIKKCVKNTNSTRRYVDETSILPGNSLILTKSQDSRGLFATLGVHGENVHHFRLLDNEKFEWIASKTGIEELKPFVNTNEYRLVEDKICENFQGRTNVICASPGMGKSVMVKFLETNCPTSLWPLVVNLKEHQGFFSSPRTGSEILDHLLEKYRGFDEKFLDIFKGLKRIVFLFDELDEVAGGCVEFILDGIQELSAMGFVDQWLCSRPNHREVLEKKFSVLTVDINEFSFKQQRSYLEKRLEGSCSEEEIRGTVANIYKNFNIIKNEGIVGVPLQLYMITEILIQNRGQGAVVGNFCVLTDMYQKFMEDRYRNYFERNGNNSGNIEVGVGDAIETRFKNYQIAAIKSCFDKKNFENLPQTKSYETFLGKIKESGDILGIINRVNDELAVFSHSTFAEFFAAFWLADNIRGVKNREFIFDERHRNVRYMLDMIAGRKCPSNIAVLHQNFADVEENQNSIHPDRLGRNPLHIACAWGEPHVPFEKISKPLDSSPKIDYMKIIKFLINRCKIDEIDQLFNWTPIKYADRTLSLAAIEGISTKHKIDFRRLENFKDPKIVAYHCIKHNYVNLFKCLKKIPYLPRERNFLTTAVELGRTSFVKKLIKKRKYRKSVNKNYLLHVAAFKGDRDIAKILIKNGARVNTRHNTPLLTAAMNGNVDVVEVLLKKKAILPKIDEKLRDHFLTAAEFGNLAIIKSLVLVGMPVNFVDGNNYSPLLLATLNGHLEVVKFLVEKGGRIQHVDKYGNTALMLATFEGHSEIVSYLIKDSEIDAVNKLGNSALSIAIDNYFLSRANRRNDLKKIGRAHEDLFSKAVVSGDLDKVKYWLSMGADVNAADQYGRTPLLEAALTNNVAIVKYLLDNGANINHKDTLGRSVLFKVKRANCLQIYDYLLKTMPNFENTESDQLLNQVYSRYETDNYLTENQNDATDDDDEKKKKLEAKLDIVLGLIAGGANVNCFDSDGRAPLSRAACADLPLVRKLVASGADVHRVDSHGTSALFYAVDGGNFKIVEYFIDQKIGLDKTNLIGETVLARAAKWGLSSIVELLTSRGAKIETTDLNGNSPLSLAAENNHLAILEHFLTKIPATVNLGEALVKAVKSRNFSVVEALLKRGAVVDGSVMLAAQNHEDMFRFLSRFYRGKIELVVKEVDVDRVDVGGLKPLSRAVLDCNLDLVERLVKREAEIDWVDPDGFTALGLAAKKVDFRIARFLVEKGAKIEPIKHLIARAAIVDSDFYHLLKKCG